MSGKGVNEQIPGMPGINRQSSDVLIKQISDDLSIGITSHMIFGVLEDHHKDENGTSAADDQMPLQQTATLRAATPDFKAMLLPPGASGVAFLRPGHS